MNTRRIHVSVCACLTAILLLTGCSTTYTGCYVCDLESSTDEALFQQYKKLFESIYAKEERPEFLLLSGGGGNGAWGVGVIKGWQEKEGRIPDFDVITGVSTGSLIAPYVFVASEHPEKVDELVGYYTSVTKSDVAAGCSNLRMLLQGYQCKPTPLKTLLERGASDELIDLVADIYRASNATQAPRLLLAGTVNLDLGEFRIWDLTRLAEQREYELFRRVLLASSSSPTFFPPVKFTKREEWSFSQSLRVIAPPPDPDAEKESIHVDGGVRLVVFYPRLIRAASEGALSIYLQRGRTPTKIAPVVYVIQNQRLSVGRQCTSNNFLGVTLRTISLQGNQNALGALNQIKQTLSDIARETGGEDINSLFKLSYIPDEIDLPSGSFDFDTEQMKMLVQEGAAWFAAGAWTAEIPVGKSRPGSCKG